LTGDQTCVREIDRVAAAVDIPPPVAPAAAATMAV
jgi:hypothetical protein